jgi:copper chaperone
MECQRKVKATSAFQDFISIGHRTPIRSIIIKKGDFKMTTLKVKGMTCQHCVMAVKKALGKLDGVQNIDVDLGKGEVHLENSKGLAADKIREAIETAGFQVESV